MSVQPIKPSEVASQKQKQIPDGVIEAFNEMIAQHFASGEASFKLKDVTALIVKKGLKRSDIFDNNWLDVEPLYEKAGWSVTYDAPAFNETYDATFTFRRRK